MISTVRAKLKQTEVYFTFLSSNRFAKQVSMQQLSLVHLTHRRLLLDLCHIDLVADDGVSSVLSMCLDSSEALRSEFCTLISV